MGVHEITVIVVCGRCGGWCCNVYQRLEGPNADADRDSGPPVRVGNMHGVYLEYMTTRPADRSAQQSWARGLNGNQYARDDTCVVELRFPSRLLPITKASHVYAAGRLPLKCWQQLRQRQVLLDHGSLECCKDTPNQNRRLETQRPVTPHTGL